MLGKISADDILKYFSFVCFPEIRLRNFMQIVSLGDNLHEISKSVFLEKYIKINKFVG